MDRIQLRRDTSANWTKYNPVLMEGEVGYETDTKKRKIGDGTNTWNNLDYLAAENISQELGDSETEVISQKTITNTINNIGLLTGGNIPFVLQSGNIENNTLVINPENTTRRVTVISNPNQPIFISIGSGYQIMCRESTNGTDFPIDSYWISNFHIFTSDSPFIGIIVRKSDNGNIIDADINLIIQVGGVINNNILSIENFYNDKSNNLYAPYIINTQYFSFVTKTVTNSDTTVSKEVTVEENSYYLIKDINLSNSVFGKLKVNISNTILDLYNSGGIVYIPSGVNNIDVIFEGVSINSIDSDNIIEFSVSKLNNENILSNFSSISYDANLVYGNVNNNNVEYTNSGSRKIYILKNPETSISVSINPGYNYLCRYGQASSNFPIEDKLVWISSDFTYKISTDYSYIAIIVRKEDNTNFSDDDNVQLHISYPNKSIYYQHLNNIDSAFYETTTIISQVLGESNLNMNTEFNVVPGRKYFIHNIEFNGTIGQIYVLSSFSGTINTSNVICKLGVESGGSFIAPEGVTRVFVRFTDTIINTENSITYKVSYVNYNKIGITNNNIKLVLDNYAVNADSIKALQASDFTSILSNQNLYTRVPFCTFTNNGTLIVGGDIRENTSQDLTKISIGIKRSEDGGKTFISPKIVIPHTNESSADRAMDATILLNRANNDLFVFAHRITTDKQWEGTHQVSDNNGFDCVFVKSVDDGNTWTQPQSLKNIIKDNSYGENVVTLFGGVGHGITMNDGTLVLPIQCKMATDNIDNNSGSMWTLQSGIIYSKDSGNTWIRCSSLVPCYSSECQVVETEEGVLMINCRGYQGYRRIYTTSNLGESWEKSIADNTIIESPSGCEGSFIKAQKGYKSIGVIVSPLSSTNRGKLTAQITKNYTEYSPAKLIVREVTNGYSDITSKEDGTVKVVSETLEALYVSDITNYIW